MPITSLSGANPCLPGANSRFPEHKIEVFVLFLPSEPLFSSISSTKSRVLCFFCLRNPRFWAFRAQNRGFCAFLPSETLVFGHFEQKIVVFVLFWASKPSFSGVSSTKLGFLCSGRRGNCCGALPSGDAAKRCLVEMLRSAVQWRCCAALLALLDEGTVA